MSRKFTGPARLSEPENLPTRIAKLQQVGAPRWPLYEATCRAIHYFEVPFTSAGTSSSSFKRWVAAGADWPAIALLGDDDDFQPRSGPDHWPIARRAIRWAATIIIHGAVGHPDHYRLAIEIARLHGKVLLIECRSRDLGAWQAACQRWCQNGRVLVLHPPPGQTHPSPQVQGAVH